MKTSNLAIVFTDIKGFTARTSQQTYEENRRMLRLHDALLMPVFRAFGGRLIKTIGDAFLVVFESPTQAVLCGVAIQDRLWDYNRRVPEADQIHVRVAINMGEVRVERGDVFGEPVNIAARVEGVADAGEVVFTEAVYLSMNKAEVPSEDRGQHELKGIPEKVRVYRVPRGAYRLASTSAERPLDLPPTLESAPPYGGLALGRIASLPAPEPTALLSGDFKELGAAIARGAAQGALSFGSRLPGLARRAGDLLSDAVRWLKAQPPRTRALLAGGTAALALVLVLGLTLSGHPVEKAIARGDLREAERELERVPAGADRLFLKGRLEEARRDWDDAAERYEQAARAGKRAGFRRLLVLSRSEVCSAREHAAYALGRLGDRSALSALRTLERSSYADEPEGRRLFGCKSRRAAAEAIAMIEARKD